MEFYIMEDQLKRGPFTLEELKKRGITPQTVVMRTNSSIWEAAEDVPELAPLLSMSQHTGQTGYGQQVPPFGGQGFAQHAGQSHNHYGNNVPTIIPNDYKVMSILMIIFGVLTCCCWFDIPFIVFGILALNAGNKVNPYFCARDYVNAQRKSDEAKRMLLWGLGTGIAWVVVSVIISLLMFSTAAYQEMIDTYMNILNDMQ